jgi:hypothetical protein
MAVLIGVALLPEQARRIPDSTIQLQNAQVTLYPRADPEAIWHFSAPSVAYAPDTRETTLRNIEDGERVLGGKTDFTLRSEAVTIDADDNLRGERILVHLLDADWDLDMQAKDERLALIDQGSGRFEVPLLLYSGQGIEESRDENVRVTFDLKNFEAGGPDTIGYSSFIATSDEKEEP